MKNRPWAIPAALFVVTVIVFFGVVKNNFVGYDDDPYIVQNAYVPHGLTFAGVMWALTNAHDYYWHPLTWLSHMTVVELFGMNPAWHHMVNVLIHAASVVLLFFLLRKMTGAVNRSAIVAALFALHPLRVESVAWASERKDVLCIFFTLAAMLAYVSGRRAWITFVLYLFA